MYDGMMEQVAFWERKERNTQPTQFWSTNLRENIYLFTLTAKGDLPGGSNTHPAI
jgi:hypothetical protein